MEIRFSTLWRSATKQSDESIARVYKTLANHYSEPHRKYHSLTHIEDCLQQLDNYDRVYPLAPYNKQLLEMALYFHDVIYEPKASDNEEQSCRFFNEMCNQQTKTEVSQNEWQNSVSCLIMATKHHDGSDLLAAITVDIDLSILGRGIDEFEQYNSAIRSEYAWVSIKDYKIGRIKVLESFLNRHGIFQNDYFKNLYEAQARSNIKNAIEALQLVIPLD